MPKLPLTAAVTAGGRSSRFGTDKALARWDDKTLLEHAAAPLAACPQRLLVAPAGRYALPGWQGVQDTRPGEGPLAGLETALKHARYDWVTFTGVDIPTLDAAYWAALYAAISPAVRSVQAVDPRGQPQPLAALYHRCLLPHVSALLDAGERRLRLACPPERTAQVTNLPAGYFCNVNSPAELALLDSTVSSRHTE